MAGMLGRAHASRSQALSDSLINGYEMKYRNGIKSVLEGLSHIYCFFLITVRISSTYR